MKLLNALPAPVSPRASYGALWPWRLHYLPHSGRGGLTSGYGSIAWTEQSRRCSSSAAATGGGAGGGVRRRWLSGLVDGRVPHMDGDSCHPIEHSEQLALIPSTLASWHQGGNTAVNANKYDLLVSLRNVRSLSLDNPILLLLMDYRAVMRCCTGSSARSMAVHCARRAQSQHGARTGHQHRARRRCVGLMLPTAWWLSPALRADAVSGLMRMSAWGAARLLSAWRAVIIGEVLFGKIFRNFATTLIAVSIGPSSTTSSAGGADSWVCPRTT